jgi:hypothetical protein
MIAGVFLVSSLLHAQSVDTSKVGTVHVYREGRLLIGISVSADGKDVVSLSPHNIATFYVSPGHHELTLRAGEISPGASFTAAPGEEYFFKVDYEHVVSARDLKMSLRMEPNTADADELREVKTDQSKLMYILESSNPREAEPANSTTSPSNIQAAQ